MAKEATLIDSDQLAARQILRLGDTLARRATAAVRDRRILVAVEMLEQCYARSSLSIGDVATFVNLSSSRFSWLFARHVGVSPGQYLKDVRLNHARLLLETTFLSVKEIMYTVGYNDGSHFSREYRARYDFSPSKYRVNAFDRAFDP